ncbi:MAG: hypothetical protein WDW36_004051 [Sanguina aurantia]
MVRPPRARLPRADQPKDLELIGEPVMFYGRPSGEMPPHPDACMITGITPQHAEREAGCRDRIRTRATTTGSAPGTCAGLSGACETMTRGPGSAALSQLLRAALRPEGIVWPLREDGSPSFRLEHLAKANNLSRGCRDAHDALSDVYALIDDGARWHIGEITTR